MKSFLIKIKSYIFPKVKCGVYLGVKTCEVFLCFVTIMFVLSFVLTYLLPVLCFLCSTSLVKVIGFYTKDEPKCEFRKQHLVPRGLYHLVMLRANK